MGKRKGRGGGLLKLSSTRVNLVASPVPHAVQGVIYVVIELKQTCFGGCDATGLHLYALGGECPSIALIRGCSFCRHQQPAVCRNLWTHPPKLNITGSNVASKVSSHVQDVSDL